MNCDKNGFIFRYISSQSQDVHSDRRKWPETAIERCIIA